MLKKYLMSSIIILGCLMLGKGFAWLVNDHFPAAIFGMLVLLSLLLSGKVHYEHVFPTAHFILKYMPLLFIPSGVALIEHLKLLEDNYWQIPLVALLSTLFTLALVGHLMQKNLKS